MEPVKREKKELAALIPYRMRGEDFEYFLQKRSDDAPRLAGMIGTFGGHFEANEDMRAALYRELKEELEYEPQNPSYFSRYEIGYGILHIFIEEVGADFESVVQVHEGEYGKFYTIEELRGKTMTPVGGIAVREIDTYLRGKASVE